MTKDRLDGTKRRNFLVELFLLPGRAILWFRYMFTGGKSYSEVRQSSRHARSPIMTFAYSALFWVVIFYFVINPELLRLAERWQMPSLCNITYLVWPEPIFADWAFANPNHICANTM